MTDNELIAEFMGIKVAPYTHYAAGDMIAIVPEVGCIDWPTLTEYCPDKSWDWLMPVVEKIGLIENPYGYRHDRRNKKHNEFESMREGVTTLIIVTEIEVVYKVVVEFIKWYNERGG